eukprot:10314783-Alexandrium_andersonii.AAC.1
MPPPFGEPPMAPPPPTTPGMGPRLVLLSLFDGAGTTRVAVDMVLNAIGEPEALAAAWFCEKDAVLAAAEERSWQTRAQQGR